MSDKPKTERSKDYRNFIRSQICLICGNPETIHHHESISGSGMGMKCPDTESVPLCVLCHHERHHYGRKSFYEEHEIDYIGKVLKYQQLYESLNGRR